MKLRFSYALTLFAALALTLLQACTTIRHIRDAQDAFNDAARAELDLGNNGSEAGAANLVAAPAASGYKISLGLLDRELADNPAELASDDLMGSALMLRALCLWRLWDLGEADAKTAKADDPTRPSAELLKALEQVKAYGVEKLGTRDRVMYHALPGLHDHDRALHAAKWEAQEKLFQSAITTTEGALTTVKPPKDHPIQSYIALAQLSTCRAWQLAAFRSEPGDPAKQLERMKKPRELFAAKLDAVRPLWQNNDRFYAQVSALCASIGVTVPPR